MSSGGLHVSGSGDRSSGSGGSDYEPWQPTCESYLYPPSHSVLHLFSFCRFMLHTFLQIPFAPHALSHTSPPPSDHECRWASTLPKVLIRLVPIRSVHTLRDGCGTETSEQFPSPRDNVYCIYYRI